MARTLKAMKPTDYQLDTRKLTDLTMELDFRSDVGDIDELAASLKEKGVLQPITINTRNRVLAGRRRFLAAQTAGLTEIPVLVKHTTDELDEREIELFENLHRKNLTWQEQMSLMARIHELMQAKHGSDWGLSSTAKLMGKGKSAIGDAVAMTKAMEVVPELRHAKTADQARRTYKRLVEEAVVQEAMEDAVAKGQKRNVVWAADHYRIGDAMEQMAKLSENCANFAEVDPPYAIDLKAYREKVDSAGSVANYNEIDAGEYPKFLATAAKLVYRALQDDSFCVWWYGPTHHALVASTLASAGFKLDPIPAIWYKVDTASPTASPDYYLNRGYEPFFIARKGQPLIRKRARSNVFAFPSPRGNRVHPTERPVELIQDILETFLYPGARILVPFLGSGNTLVAAYGAGMTGWGYDLSESYRSSFLARVAKDFPDEDLGDKPATEEELDPDWDEAFVDDEDESELENA